MENFVVSKYRESLKEEELMELRKALLKIKKHELPAVVVERKILRLMYNCENKFSFKSALLGYLIGILIMLLSTLF